MTFDMGKHLELLTREAEDFGDAIDAELAAAESGEEERSQALARAAEFWALLFADLQSGLGAADAARAGLKSARERLKSLRDHYEGQLRDVERRLEVADEAVRRALLAAAKAAGTDTIRVKGERVNVGLVRTPARVVVDVPAELLPRSCQRVSVEPDKKALASALKGGEEIPGVRLERGLRVDWRGA